MLSGAKERGTSVEKKSEMRTKKMSPYASYSCFVCWNESLWLTVNRWSHMPGCLGKSL